MSNKHLDEDTIVNELKGSSLYFKKEQERPATATEKNRLSTPVKAILVSPDAEPRLPSSVPLFTAQVPRQPPTTPLVASVENTLPSLPYQKAPSMMGSAQAVQEHPKEDGNVTFDLEDTANGTGSVGISGTTDVRPSETATGRTPVRVKRTITRYAFEFFQDQVETLKALSLQEQLRGDKGSMSQMVRDALDRYIAGRKTIGD